MNDEMLLLRRCQLYCVHEDVRVSVYKIIRSICRLLLVRLAAIKLPWILTTCKQDREKVKSCTRLVHRDEKHCRQIYNFNISKEWGICPKVPISSDEHAFCIYENF